MGVSQSPIEKRVTCARKIKLPWDVSKLARTHLITFLNWDVCKSAYANIFNTLSKRMLLWSSGLVVKMLDSHFKGPGFKLTEWLQGRLRLSSFRGSSNVVLLLDFSLETAECYP